MEITGKYNTAKVMTHDLDTMTHEQIKGFLDESFTAGEKIVIMPDTHSGKGAVVGTTMTTNNNQICPNLVGVDIGCGILLAKIEGVENIDQSELKKLDQVIKRHIPYGFDVNKTAAETNIDLDKISFTLRNKNRVYRSIGSLGGGNHFIELGRLGTDYALMIHSGSRNLGHQVASHHQKVAERDCLVNEKDRKRLIKQLKKEGRDLEIEERLKAVQSKVNNKDLAYLEGDHLELYLHDMYIAQEFAKVNRQEMLDRIAEHMGWRMDIIVDSVHNYIGDDGILRKGATNANEGQLVVIPINMRDGAILGRGLGNAKWNYSAPHGAGRLMSRTMAKNTIPFATFKEQMKGIYSTTISQDTLDEAPDAYKPLDQILSNITETIEVVDIITPIYNFKA